MIICPFRWPYAALVFICVFALALLLISCGGSGTNPPASVTITPLTSSISIHGQQAFAAVAKDSGGNVITGATFAWTSSQPNIASINASGVATGMTPGTTTILAISNAGSIKSNLATLMVTPVISKITISPSSATIAVGASQAFTATAYDVNNDVVATAFQWTNLSSSVASIDANGVATGAAAGTTTIFASAGGVTSPGASLTVQ